MRDDSQHHNLRTLRVTEPRTHLMTRLKVMELVRGCTPKTLLGKTKRNPGWANPPEVFG